MCGVLIDAATRVPGALIGQRYCGPVPNSGCSKSQ